MNPIANFDPPTEQEDFKAAKAAYDPDPPQKIGDWGLTYKAASIKCYTRFGPLTGKGSARAAIACLLAIRGTEDADDVKADTWIPLNKLVDTNVYKRVYFDVDYLVRNRFPNPNIKWYLTGHSLGGAIALALAKNFPNMFTSELLFNSALQPSNIITPTDGARLIYNERDPLYNTAGRFYRGDKEVHSGTDPLSWSLWGKASQSLESHKLDSLAHIYGSGRKQLDAQTSDETIAHAMSYALTDEDMRTVLGRDVSLHEYPELSTLSVDTMFDSQGRCVLLELTKPSSGHWVCMLKTPGKLEYFSSYGDPPTGKKSEMDTWLTYQQRTALQENDGNMQRILDEAKAKGFSLAYNNVDLQSKRSGVETCGRHVCCRLLNRHLNLTDYLDMIQASGKTPDEYVVLVTQRILGK